jgi:hypothetical protein
MASETEHPARPVGRRRGWPVNPLLPIGDAAVFAVFTLAGLASHRDAFTPYHFLRNFVPFTVCWFLFAAILDTYGGRAGARRLAANLVLGVLAGVTVRVWWVGGPNGRQLGTFLVVALLTNGVILLAWRLVAGRLLSGRKIRLPSEP